MTLPLARPWKIVAAIVFAAWVSLCALHLSTLDVAATDSWAYFACGVARPFHVVAPLMGDFLGSDHTWGIHWPGAPVLYSVLRGPGPVSGGERIFLFIVMTSATAALTFRLLKTFLGMPTLALAGVGILLADRMWFGMMTLARPEIVSTLALTALVLLLTRLEHAAARRPWQRAAAGGCFLLLPTLHPVLPVITGLLVAYALWRAWQRGELAWGLTWAGCYAAGVILLLGWFYFQPDAWQQFQVNARANSRPFGWGRVFGKYLGEYAPTYGATLLYGLALVGCWVRWPWRRAGGAAALEPGGESSADWGVPLVVLVGGTLAAQVFPTPFYQLVVLPEAILFALAALYWLGQRGARGTVAAAPAWWVVPCVLAFAVVHGLFWFTRTLKYVQSGRASLRAEMHQIFVSLPPARTVLIPDLMWEEALSQPDKYYLYTILYPCTRETRLNYEASVRRKTGPGDLLLLSRHQLSDMLTPIAPEEWEEIGHYEHQMPSRTFWGYELVLYRHH